MQISVSRLRAYSLCPQKYFYRYVATARRALIAAESNPVLATRIRSRLALYLQGRAYEVP